jgi:p-hydroxybenzoate 3-monooxygenase
MAKQRTEVAIIGAGPSGLLLAHLLNRAGVETVVLERQSRPYVEARIRAGVLEQGTVDLLDEVGLGARMRREGLPHQGFDLAFDGSRHRINLFELTGGKQVMIYGQTELTKDLGDQRASSGAPVLYEAADVSIHDADGAAPLLRYQKDGSAHMLRCDIIAACDGGHGVGRRSMPAGLVKTFERVYPFGWLGLLADVPPCSHELIYARHQRGFALASMRSHQRSRYYVQCVIDEKLENWPDERIWEELKIRLGPEAAANMKSGHRPFAQLRRRADALGPAVPGRRRRPYRAADGRQGPQSRGLRRAHPRPRPHLLLQEGRQRPHRRIFSRLPGEGLEGGALLLVDDPTDAQVR